MDEFKRIGSGHPWSCACAICRDGNRNNPMSEIKRAYALRNNKGYWVGIWNDRATAENVRAKTREKEEVIEMYTESALAQARAGMKERCAQFVEASGLPFAQAAILAEGIRAIDDKE